MKLIIFAFTFLLFLGIRADLKPQYDQERVVFPGLTKRQHSNQRQADPDSKLALAIKIARELSQLETRNELNNYLNLSSEKMPGVDSEYSSFSQTFSQRSNVESTPSAKCKPELQTVPTIKNPDDYIYDPSCIKIKRCGGCCYFSNFLACEPTAIVPHNYEVKKFKIINNSLMQFGKEIVTIDEHTKCFCACKTKKEDCTKHQVYIEDRCSCVCLNQDEEDKCKGEEKWWDSNVCKCFCKDRRDCNSGFEFDEETCSCKPMARRRFWANDKITTSYNHQPAGHTAETPIIFPLNANDPRRKPKEDPEY